MPDIWLWFSISKRRNLCQVLDASGQVDGLCLSESRIWNLRLKKMEAK